MPKPSGLVFACVLDRDGGGRFGGWDLLRAWSPEDGLLWVHLDFAEPDSKDWVIRESGLDELTCAALFARESRPRSLARDGGLLVDLRGVNLNPGAEPDDMISVRIWLEEGRVLTLRHRHLKAIEDLKQEVQEGRGPEDSGEFLVGLTDHLLRRMASSFEDLDQRIDALHGRIGREAGAALRVEVSQVRSEIIGLRRYLAPQRDAIARLWSEKVPWLSDVHRERVRDLADRTTRRVEDLEAARDRAAVAHEELTSRMAEQMNRTMYILAIVAAIFLPLGLITGLLGINVGGIPGSKDGSAFWIVCGTLGALAVVQYWFFKRMRWM